VHSVAIARGRLVKDVPPEVSLAVLPDKTRKGPLQCPKVVTQF
jgi:hypothetical protein